MDMNRRELLNSIFIGALFSNAFPSFLRQDNMNYPHENYIAAEKKFNIWEHRNDFWYLITNSNGAPLEFDSEMLAKEHMVREYEKNHYVRRAPTKLHCMDYLRRSASQIDEFLIRNSIKDSYPQEVFSKMLAANNGAEQARIWVDSLQKPERVTLQGFRDNKPVTKMIREVFCSDSYHSELAKLETFHSGKWQ